MDDSQILLKAAENVEEDSLDGKGVEKQQETLMQQMSLYYYY